jgi:aminotransferase
MTPLSHHTNGLVQNDIRGITKLVNAVGGINLGQGICDMPTPDPIKHGAHRAIDEDRSIYSSNTGILPLREAILQKAQAFNRIPATSVDEVMVSVGSTGAFMTCIFVLLDPGDEIILFDPFYGYHKGLLNLTGVTQTYVPLHGHDWELDLDELRAAITPRTKAILINTPGNPCGKVWTRAELQAVLELMVEHDLYAITDEIYEYMVYDGREHVSLASLPGAYERTVTLSGFSKTYNMTGWRLGYAVGPAPILEKMALLNDLIYICAPTPLQHGVAEAFAMSESYFAEMLAAYTQKRQMMCEALEAAGFDVPWPQGSYYVLASFAPLMGQRAGFEDPPTASRTLIREAGVATVPGHSFFSNPEDGRHYVRFCYAKEFPVLEQACNQLRAAYG